MFGTWRLFVYILRKQAQNLCVSHLKSFSVFKLETLSDIIKCFSQSECCSSFLRLGEVHFDRHDSIKLTHSSSILISSWSSLTSKGYFWIISVVEHRSQQGNHTPADVCVQTANDHSFQNTAIYCDINVRNVWHPYSKKKFRVLFVYVYRWFCCHGCSRD